MSNWLSNTGDSNKFKQIYVKGFVDVSGGDIINRTGNLAVGNDATIQNRLYVTNDVSFNGNLNVLGQLGMNIENNIVMNSGIINQSLTSSSTFNPSVNTDTVLSNRLIITNTTVSTSVSTGSLLLSGGLGVNGNIYSSGSVVANGTTLTSDYRIKKVIRVLDSNYNVDDLVPVHFYNTLSKKEDIGIIAHELQERYPYLVDGIKDGLEYQHVNYNGLIGIMLNEIKMLKQEIKKLQEQR
jgi:hypothetical protein